MKNEIDKSNISGGIPVEVISENFKEVLNQMGKVLDYKREAKITERELEKYRTKRDIVLMKLASRHEELDKKLKRIDKKLDLEKEAIERFFKFFDKSLEQDNVENIKLAMGGIIDRLKDNSVFDVLKDTPVFNDTPIDELEPL